MRTVLVTGASRGMGLEFVRQYLARGDRVFACVRLPGQSSVWPDLAAAHPGRLTVLTLDLAHHEEFGVFAAVLADHCKSLDLLINNAGLMATGERYGSVLGRNLIDSFTTNAAAPLLLTQALTPLLSHGQSPTVLMLSSELASIAQRKAFHTPSYSISKAALNMATRLLAFELSAKGIGCVALHPGWVQTDMGGPQAPLLAVDAVRAMLAFVDQLRPEQHGGFFSSDGTRLPW